MKLRNAALVAVVLVVSAFGQSITAGNNTFTACKNEGDPDCTMVIGQTMFRVELTDNLVVTDGFRDIARIDKEGKVTIVGGVTAEYVIRVMAHYWEDDTRDSNYRHQAELKACMDGWKHTINVLKIASKPNEASK